MKRLQDLFRFKIYIAGEEHTALPRYTRRLGQGHWMRLHGVDLAPNGKVRSVYTCVFSTSKSPGQWVLDIYLWGETALTIVVQRKPPYIQIDRSYDPELEDE